MIDLIYIFNLDESGLSMRPVVLVATICFVFRFYELVSVKHQTFGSHLYCKFLQEIVVHRQRLCSLLRSIVSRIRGK